jgi:hypothetical protein
MALERRSRRSRMGRSLRDSGTVGPRGSEAPSIGEQFGDVGDEGAES